MSKGTLPTPELDKLKLERPRTEAIQAFLEFMHEKGYELKRTIPSGWCPPGGGDRVKDSELEARGLIRVSMRDLVWLGMDSERRICVPVEVIEKLEAGIRAQLIDRSELVELVSNTCWEWDRSFEQDDVGYEGHTLDRFLYEFIEVDPQKIDDERRALIDALNKGST